MRIAHRLLSAVAVLSLAVLPLAGRADAQDAGSIASLKYLPNNSDYAVTFNVRRLLDSAIAKRNLELIKPALKADENFQKTMDALGLDPFKDIEYILVGGPGGSDPDKAFVVVQGKFDTKKLHATAEKAAKDNPDMLKIEKVGNDSLYEITPPGKGEKQMYAAILDGTTLVGSRTRDLVTDALEKKSGKQKSELKKELSALLAKADSKQAMSFVALEAAGPSDVAGLVTSATGGLTIDEDVKMDIVMNTKDNDAAKSVSMKIKDGLNQVKGFVGVLALKDKKWMPAVDVLTSMKVDDNASKVTIKGEVSKSVIEKLEKMIKDAKQ